MVMSSLCESARFIVKYVLQSLPLNALYVPDSMNPLLNILSDYKVK